MGLTRTVQILVPARIPRKKLELLQEDLNRLHGWENGTVPMETPQDDLHDLTKAHRRLAATQIVKLDIAADETGRLYFKLEKP